MMKHTPGPVEATWKEGAYPICVCEEEHRYFFVNAKGPVREDAKDDAEFIAWCYNHVDELVDALKMYRDQTRMRGRSIAVAHDDDPGTWRDYIVLAELAAFDKAKRILDGLD